LDEDSKEILDLFRAQNSIKEEILELQVEMDKQYSIEVKATNDQANLEEKLNYLRRNPTSKVEPQDQEQQLSKEIEELKKKIDYEEKQLLHRQQKLKDTKGLDHQRISARMESLMKANEEKPPLEQLDQEIIELQEKLIVEKLELEKFQTLAKYQELSADELDERKSALQQTFEDLRISLSNEEFEKKISLCLEKKSELNTEINTLHNCLDNLEYQLITKEIHPYAEVKMRIEEQIFLLEKESDFVDPKQFIISLSGISQLVRLQRRLQLVVQVIEFCSQKKVQKRRCPNIT